LHPGIRIGDREKSGSEIRVELPPDYFSGSLETGFKIVEFFDADPDPGFGIFLTLDPGSRKGKLGSGINIQDPQNWPRLNLPYGNISICYFLCSRFGLLYSTLLYLPPL
jgi:hypothetical protein